MSKTKFLTLCHKPASQLIGPPSFYLLRSKILKSSSTLDRLLSCSLTFSLSSPSSPPLTTTHIQTISKFYWLYLQNPTRTQQISLHLPLPCTSKLPSCLPCYHLLTDYHDCVCSTYRTVWTQYPQWVFSPVVRSCHSQLKTLQCSSSW